MAKGSMRTSTKRVLIDKANSRIVIIVAVAAALTMFSLVASRALLSKRSYQSKVIGQQEQARDQLEANIEAVDVLTVSYGEFVDRPENIIGGNSNGDGERDGDNAKIVLDALPSRYDFPALAASLEKILVDRNYQIDSITGTDAPPGQEDANGQQDISGDTSGSLDTEQTQTTPAGVEEMPFEFTAQGSYTSMIDLLRVLQRSVRPLKVNQLTMAAGRGAGSGQIQLTINGQSYYQPEKNLDIRYEVVE